MDPSCRTMDFQSYVHVTGRTRGSVLTVEADPLDEARAGALGVLR